jgi:xanthine/uracil permease
MALITLLAVAGVAVYLPATLRRLPILLGGIIGYIVSWLGGLAGLGPQIDFTPVAKAAWVGLPTFASPTFTGNAISLIAPVAVILVAENTGHLKAVAAMTGSNLDRYLGRAFLGDAAATIISGLGGGMGVTTYAENIGAMAVSRIYSSLVFVVAGIVAILLGLCPKFGALIGTIPQGVIGGLAIVLFGLIAATGGRIWVENQVDFSKSRNLITAAVSLTIGAGMVGNLGITIGNLTVGGIGVVTFTAIILYQILRERNPQPEEAVSADAAVGRYPENTEAQSPASSEE